MTSTPPDKNEKYDQIVRVICEELEKIDSENKDLTAASDLTMDVHLDSASTMMLVFSLEEEFDVSIPLNDLGNLNTVGDLADLLQKS